jgi:hypothetical protein
MVCQETAACLTFPTLRRSMAYSGRSCNNYFIKNFPTPKTDGHGCLVSAGYSYCPETKDCIKFDENCPIKGA